MNDWLKYRNYDRRTIFWGAYGLLFLGAVLLGGLVGMVFGYSVDLPRVQELEANQPSVVSYVYADDGRVLGQFALERRILISYEQIPQTIKEAILAAEDAQFFSHSGIDFRRMLATAVNNIIHWDGKGGSTLTMQLSKMRFTSTEKTLERKIKDILYAIDIEKNYSKEQVFTFYCNQIPLGHGTYGIAAAAEFYFHKTLDELDLAESALLAGITQTPARYSPILHSSRALTRRNWVLGRMKDEGFISEAGFREAVQQPIVVQDSRPDDSPAPYFLEWVRQYLAAKYPTSDIWQGGLRVYTTVNYDMQTAAERALQQGLIAFDRQRRGWAGAEFNILDQGEDLSEYAHPAWRLLFYEGQLIHGLTLESSAESATVRLGSLIAEVGLDEIEWTRKKRVDEVLKPGDVAVFRLEGINRAERTITVSLQQIPEAQGAVYAVDNRTGAVKAMVGGFDFERSKFNRATQALRQPGSIFKPFTYAAALEAGYSPFDRVLDAPVEFRDGLGRPYAPSNSDHEFKGLIPIHQALAESRNIPTVRLANAIGPQKVADIAQRFGIRRNLPPYLSLALGAAEVTLSEIVSAFSAFPNNGVRTEPYFIQRVEDYNGVTLEEHRPRAHFEVMRPEIADEMIYLLRGAVQRGTGHMAQQLGRPVAGKTGTTNDFTDSWFVGFVPQITAGVWIGHDTKKSLGNRVYGATLALPIWVDFMKEALQDLPPEDFRNRPPREPFSTQIVDSGGTTEPFPDLELDPREDAPAGPPSIEVEDITPNPPTR